MEIKTKFNFGDRVIWMYRGEELHGKILSVEIFAGKINKAINYIVQCDKIIKSDDLHNLNENELTLESKAFK